MSVLICINDYIYSIFSASFSIVTIIAPINRFIKGNSEYKVENLKMTFRRNRLCH